MTIGVLSFQYNEEFLLPLFLRHYAGVDRIHIIVDADTNDNTRGIIDRWPNATREDYRFPDMMDDELKVTRINSVLPSMGTDWIYVVDADEFIWPEQEDPYRFLQNVDGNVVMAAMWQVYRHHTDLDVDRWNAPAYQRRHGDADLTTHPNNMYIKPIVLWTGCGRTHFQLAPGNHSVAGNVKIATRKYAGVHWAMADPCFCIQRRVRDRRQRQSQNNLQRGYTVQHHKVTEQEIVETCAAHLDDRLLF